MKQILILILFVLTSNISFAQNCNEKEFQKKIISADSCVIVGSYIDALNYYDKAVKDCKSKEFMINDFKKNLINKMNNDIIILKKQTDLSNELDIDSQILRVTSTEQKVKEFNELFEGCIYLMKKFQEDNKLENNFKNWLESSVDSTQFDNILIHFINNAESMASPANKRNEWIEEILPKMNSEQKIRLFNILINEKSKLYIIKNKYKTIEKSFEFYKSDLIKIKRNELSLDEFLTTKTIKDSLFLNALGDSLRRNFKNESAISIYKKNVELLSENEGSLIGLSSANYNINNYQEAYNFSLRLLNLNANNYSHLFNHSFYCLFVGNYIEGISAAKKSLEINPKKVSVESNLALGYLLNNQIENAYEIYNKWKGKKFTDNNLKYCNEIFLKDIHDLELAGIQHVEFSKVKQLLE